jgi:glycosyltransferase involved in cell wall biosynthesis
MAPDSIARPRVTIVLPHRESFGPAAAGAVAMAVQRLAAGGSRYQSLVVGPPVKGAGFPGIDFLPVRVPRFLPLTVTQAYAAALVRTLARLPPGPVEVHNKPDVALWLARCLPGRTVSLFLHNDPRSMRGARSPAARARLLRRLARVVTVSDFLRGAMLEGVAAPARLPVVLHNALDPAALPDLLPMPAREKLILFAGRVVPDKAPDVFVAACAQALPKLAGWRAAMIGTDGFGAEVAESAFIRRLRPAAEAAGIVLHGHLPHAEVLRAMARAAIVVVPSRWAEPFGMTALEALACGAALACSRRGGLAEVAGDAALPIDPDDAGGVAASLVRLAGDGGLRASLAEAGRRRAAALFALPDAIARLDALRDASAGAA